MEQIIPFEDPDDPDSDPITQSVDFYESGDRCSAFQILGELLAEDLRCIDAHAHLGNWEFDCNEISFRFSREKAKRHYEVGVRIAELSLGSNFHDLLPWSSINNRPYLRCLHGLGLCLWRSGKVEAAREVFEKMLWLNPHDNQGARSLLADIDAGKNWLSLQASEQGIE
jgi:tetratricopeptide (TPR) repeat protein